MTNGKNDHMGHHRIIDLVASTFELTPADLIKRSRRPDLSLPRYIAMYLIRKRMNLSLPHIGRLFERDHTSVYYGINRMTAMMAEDHSLTMDVSAIERTLDVEAAA
jgi:chromosomal replication initiator protein